MCSIVKYCVRIIACNKRECMRCVSAVGLWFERSCWWRLGSICAASAFRDCARACGCVCLRYIGVSRLMIRANADGMVLFIAEPHRV